MYKRKIFFIFNILLILFYFIICNLIDGDGWGHDCKVEKYYDWKSYSNDSKDVWTIKWGDGYKVFTIL